MARKRNTDRSGRPFDSATVQKVWEKGRPISGSEPAIWRRDECGMDVKRADYGNTGSQYGWEIDHIRPVAKGGTDALSNLQPLHWKTNRDKGDAYPWSCP